MGSVGAKTYDKTLLKLAHFDIRINLWNVVSEMRNNNLAACDGAPVSRNIISVKYFKFYKYVSISLRPFYLFHRRIQNIGW